MVLILQHSDIRIYLENSPDLPLQINFGDSETYAQEAIQHVINPGALGKGKGNSASYHGDENVDNPIIPEKKKAVKKWRVNILWIEKYGKNWVIFKLQELNHIKTVYSFEFSL